MSIVETFVTPSHRYYMKRTKAVIINHIEMLEKTRFTPGEHSNLMTMSKGELASRAMKAHRSLPNVD